MEPRGGRDRRRGLTAACRIVTLSNYSISEPRGYAVASTVRTAAHARRELADEVVSLIPVLKRRFQATLPAQLHEELGATTTHQLEALHLLYLTVAAADDR